MSREKERGAASGSRLQAADIKCHLSSMRAKKQQQQRRGRASSNVMMSRRSLITPCKVQSVKCKVQSKGPWPVEEPWHGTRGRQKTTRLGTIGQTRPEIQGPSTSCEDAQDRKTRRHTKKKKEKKKKRKEEKKNTRRTHERSRKKHVIPCLTSRACPAIPTPST